MRMLRHGIAGSQVIAAGVPSDGADLPTNLVAWWDLDDVNDDSGNGLTLTNNNTVTFESGLVGNAAHLDDASTQYLSIANASMGDLHMGTSDFTVAFWANPDVTPQANHSGIAGSGGNTAGEEGWQVVLYETDMSQIRARLSTGTTLYTLPAVLTAGLSASTWYFVLVEFDRSGNIQAWLNNTAESETVDISTDVATDITGSEDFYIGKHSKSAGDAWAFDGFLDSVAIWNRVLTTAEKTWLYNSGSGRAYSEIG